MRRGPTIGMLAVAVALTLGYPSISRATHPLGTEEPGTTPPLTVDVELTFERAHFGGEAGGDETAVAISMTTGLRENLDIGLTAPYLVLDPDGESSEGGVGDMEVALKYALRSAEGEPGLAAKLAVTVPTGDEDEGLGTGGYDVAATLLAEVPVGPVDIYANLSWTRVDEVAEGDRESLYAASLAAAWEAAERLTLVGEALWESAPAEGEEGAVAATAGAVWSLSERFSVDGGVRVGLTDAAADWTALAGANYSLGGDE